MFGLKDEELKELKEYLKKSNINSSFIFGSRAKGNYKLGSDVDIAVDGDERKASYLLNEESNLPYYFDIVNINKIKNKNLLDHIKRVEVLFWKSRDTYQKETLQRFIN